MAGSAEVLRTPGERLRAARKRAGLDQKAVAQAAGVHEKTVSRWENDAQVPDSEAAAKVAELLGTDMVWLLTGKLAGPRYSDDGIPRMASPRLSFEGSPHRVREWLAAFQLELVRANATEEELTEAMELLQSPVVRSYFMGGARSDRSEADILKDMEALADAVIRPRLKTRGRAL